MTRCVVLDGSRMVALLATALLTGMAGVASAQDGFRVVVNQQNPVSALSKSDLARLFLDKATWEDGAAVAPVDLLPASPLREGFSRDMLGLPVPAAIDRMLDAARAAGTNPPPAMASDREVLAYVRLKSGAIGYVSLAADVSGVKVVPIGGKTEHLVQGLAHTAPAAPLVVGGRIGMPHRVVHEQPIYPAIARMGKVEGTVEVSIVIDAAGNVQQAKVVRSVPQLDGAALEAVRKWKYSPTIVNGVAVPVTMVVHVTFAL